MQNDSFWAGDFGTEYTGRNRIDPSGRVPFFRKILALTPEVETVCELGANRGHNLLALAQINPALSLTGVEINADAFHQLSTLPSLEAVHASLFDFAPSVAFDLVFTAGLLIHIAPQELSACYERIAALSARYVLLVEYFSPEPVEVLYRGHSGRLWKRDFGSEFLHAAKDRYVVKEYGFLWKAVEPAWDNATWWLFQTQR